MILQIIGSSFTVTLARSLSTQGYLSLLKSSDLILALLPRAHTSLYLNLFHVIRHQGFYLIQQKAHNFPVLFCHQYRSLWLLASLTKFNSRQPLNLQTASLHAQTMPLYFFCPCLHRQYTALFFCVFCQEPFIHPRRTAGFFAWYPIHYDGPLLCFKDMVLEQHSAFLDSYSALSHGAHTSRSLNSLKFDLPKFSVVSLLTNTQ